MENFLHEAFQRLSLMEDDFELTSDSGKLDELREFISDDIDELPEEEIVDVEAETENDLADNYVGKVILECECCHSRIYKDEQDVIVGEEGDLANVDEECPICNNTLGYTIIGKIESFEGKPKEEEEIPEVEEDEYVKTDDDLADDEAFPEDDIDLESDEEDEDVEDEEEEEDKKEESFRRHQGRKLTESKRMIKENIDSPLKTIISYLKNKVDVDGSIEGADEVYYESHTRHHSQKVDEAVEVNATGEDSVNVVKDDEGNLDIKVGNSTEVEGEGEYIAPLTDEDQDEIMANGEEEPEDEFNFGDIDLEGEGPEEGEEGSEETEEEEPEEGEEEEVEEVREESFDYLGTSFLKRVYSNVDNFETTAVMKKGNEFMVEGLINYKSGKQRPTRFVFTSQRRNKSGKYVMEGYNDTFSGNARSFQVTGKLVNKVYNPEKLKYRFSVKNLAEGKTNDVVKVSGVVVK